jgi:hypothetical protein
VRFISPSVFASLDDKDRNRNPEWVQAREGERKQQVHHLTHAQKNANLVRNFLVALLSHSDAQEEEAHRKAGWSFGNGNRFGFFTRRK